MAAQLRKVGVETMTCPLCGEIEEFCLCDPTCPCFDCPDLYHCEPGMEDKCRTFQEWCLRED